MMYSSGFVCSVKVEGKILRENGGSVTLPFGSEYSLLLKNLGSRKAMAKVWVNGTDATDGTRLIIPANSSIDLERFIKNGNLNSGNKFKFIERTESVENHRGIQEDDGLIRVEFWSEKEVVEQPIVRRHYYDEWYPVPRPYYWPYTSTWIYNPTITYGAIGSQAQANCSSQSVSLDNNVQTQNAANLCRSAAFHMSEVSAPLNDAGITVPGSESNQQFHSASGFALESNSKVITLQLKGVHQGKSVSAPITVDVKSHCQTCGKQNKSTSKFCSECGTSLQLI